MKGNGKRWIGLALTCFLCWTGSTQALAGTIPPRDSNQEAKDNASTGPVEEQGEGVEHLVDGDASVVFEGVADVSSMVYQAGGFGTPVREDFGITAYTISAENQVKSEILLALLAEEKSLDVSAYEMTKDELQVLFAEVLNENGELFYVKSYLSYWSMNGKIRELEFSYESVTDEQKQAYADKMAEAVSLVTDTMSDMEKALVLHDYLAQHCAYAYQEYLDNTLDSCPNVYDAYGALVRGRSVCQGYSEAYQALLGKVGIQSYVCSSESMNHAWNVVLIDGNWYHVDVTWDDPTWNREGKAYHEYFLLSDTEIAARKHNGWVDNVECDSAKYDDYWWREVASQIVQIDFQDYVYVKDLRGKFQLIRRTGETENVIYNNNLYWNVWESSSYWSKAYAFLSRQGNNIYFNDRTNVYSMSLDDLADAFPKVEYTYDKNDGYIYGAMVYEDGKVCLNIGQAPNEKTDKFIEACEVTVTPKPDVPNTAYCVFGVVKSFGNETSPSIVELVNATQGTVTAKQSVTGNAAEYRLENVPAGTYTLRVSKPDHVTREYPVTMTNANVIQNVEIRLLGDVNGDGKISFRDKKMLYNHIERISVMSGYLFDVGDVNGDGKISFRDKKMLYNHIERITPLWEMN